MHLPPSSFAALCACSRREELAPFQIAEAIDVRRKSDAFSVKVDLFRAFFQQRAPFAVASDKLTLEHVSLCLQGISCEGAKDQGVVKLDSPSTTLAGCPLHLYVDVSLPLQVKQAYELLDNFHHGSVEGHPSVIALTEESEVLRKQQDMFELYVSDYIYLQRCMVRGRLGFDSCMAVASKLSQLRSCTGFHINE